MGSWRLKRSVPGGNIDWSRSMYDSLYLYSQAGDIILGFMSMTICHVHSHIDWIPTSLKSVKKTKIIIAVVILWSGVGQRDCSRPVFKWVFYYSSLPITSDSGFSSASVWDNLTPLPLPPGYLCVNVTVCMLCWTRLQTGGELNEAPNMSHLSYWSIKHDTPCRQEVYPFP